MIFQCHIHLPDANRLQLSIQRHDKFETGIAAIYNFETQAQGGFLSKTINPQSYKRQYMAFPESNCW